MCGAFGTLSAVACMTHASWVICACRLCRNYLVNRKDSQGSSFNQYRLTDGRWDKSPLWRFESFWFFAKNKTRIRRNQCGWSVKWRKIYCECSPSCWQLLVPPKVWQRPPSLSALPKMFCRFPGTVRLLKMTVTIISNYRLFCQRI